LYYYIINQLDTSKRCYVFLDEIQQVKEFERLVDGLYVKSNIDVYVTGSNAYLLSSELCTLLMAQILGSIITGYCPAIIYTLRIYSEHRVFQHDIAN